MYTSEQLFAEAASRVDYNPTTGKFTWLAKKDVKGTGTATWNTRFAGRECGKLRDTGHITIRFKFGAYSFLIPAHRVGLVYNLWRSSAPTYRSHK